MQANCWIFGVWGGAREKLPPNTAVPQVRICRSMRESSNRNMTLALENLRIHDATDFGMNPIDGVSFALQPSDVHGWVTKKRSKLIFYMSSVSASTRCENIGARTTLGRYLPTRATVQFSTDSAINKVI